MTFVQSQKNETSEIRGLPSYAWWNDLVKYLLESLSYFWIRKPIYIGLFFFHLLSLYFTCITSMQNWFWKTRIHRYEIPGPKDTELGWFIFIIRRFFFNKDSPGHQAFSYTLSSYLIIKFFFCNFCKNMTINLFFCLVKYVLEYFLHVLREVLQ